MSDELWEQKLADARQEVERLRAQLARYEGMASNPKCIEAASRAAWQHVRIELVSIGKLAPQWEDLTEAQRDRQREIARDRLAAALAEAQRE